MLALRRALTLATALIATAALKAEAAPQLSNLSSADAEKVIRELSASSNYHSVTPPSSMGSVFGFELGLIGGVTKTPDIDGLVKRTSASAEMPAFPHAGLLAAVSVPFGVTGELVYVPEIDVSGVKYKNYAGALKWTLTDSVLGMLPLNLAVRGFLSKTDVSFSQTVSGFNSTVAYDGQVTGLQVMVSPKLIPIIEPYAGLGFLSAKGTMNVTGTSIFASGSQGFESSPTSTQFFLGADVRLLLIGFGVEYSRAFDTDSFSGKFSLKF